MTGKKKTKRFSRPEFAEYTIMDENDKRLATIRIKPSTISWKPKGTHKYFNVSLEKFSDWIQDPATGAKRTTK